MEKNIQRSTKSYAPSSLQRAPLLGWLWLGQGCVAPQVLKACSTQLGAGALLCTPALPFVDRVFVSNLTAPECESHHGDARCASCSRGPQCTAGVMKALRPQGFSSPAQLHRPRVSHFCSPLHLW